MVQGDFRVGHMSEPGTCRDSDHCRMSSRFFERYQCFLGFLLCGNKSGVKP